MTSVRSVELPSASLGADLGRKLFQADHLVLCAHKVRAPVAPEQLTVSSVSQESAQGVEEGGGVHAIQQFNVDSPASQAGEEESPRLLPAIVSAGGTPILDRPRPEHVHAGAGKGRGWFHAISGQVGHHWLKEFASKSLANDAGTQESADGLGTSLHMKALLPDGAVSDVAALVSRLCMKITEQ